MFTVAFLNTSCLEPKVFVWVFVNEEAYLRGLKDLGLLSFIKIIQSGVSVLKV